MKAIERLYEYLAFKGIKPGSFEKLAGISNGYLSKQYARKADIGESILVHIIENSPDLDPVWLLTGVGSMLKTIQHFKDEQITIAAAIKSTDEKGIPLIPLEAVAGVMSDNNMQILKHECEYYRVPLFKTADFLMQVTGDSMQPKYYSGDIVACRKVVIGTFFQWNRVYVIDTNQGVIIKRIHEGKNESRIRLVSDNADYRPFEISLDDVYSIAIVVGVVRAE